MRRGHREVEGDVKRLRFATWILSAVPGAPRLSGGTVIRPDSVIFPALVLICGMLLAPHHRLRAKTGRLRGNRSAKPPLRET